MIVNGVKSKIQRVKVTQADLNYIGSITIDEKRMKASHIIKRESVQIVHVNTRERAETCANICETKSFIPTMIFPNEETNLIN